MGCLFIEGPSPGVDWTQVMTSGLCYSCLIGEMCVKFEAWSDLLWAPVGVRIMHKEHS